MSNVIAFGLGIGTKNSKEQWLDVFYSQPLYSIDENLQTLLASVFGKLEQNTCIQPDHTLLNQYIDACKSSGFEGQADLASALMSADTSKLIICLLVEDSAPQSVPEGYLKLQLLSSRQALPHTLNLDGLFGVLPNVAWTNHGPIDVNELASRQLKARINNETLLVHCVDKFPPMCHYVVPEGVRIADTSRVRLGAYIGEGTTVMHEGFVNFNAGTKGPNMIEGRISAGVVVGKGSDLGGGCSTMGTLSGGGSIVISVGEDCLIGANAGTGIPLGDRCTIESGLYITAGTKVSILDTDGKEQRTVKARELANVNDLLFRRNSTTGKIECHANKSVVELNDMLHKNN